MSAIMTVVIKNVAYHLKLFFSFSFPEQIIRWFNKSSSTTFVVFNAKSLYEFLIDLN